MPRLGLQVGWLVIAGAVAGMLIPWSLKRPGRSISLRLGVLGTIALFAAWSPFDFWSAVPRLFHFVQFTYRLLGFVVIFGAMLTAFGVAALLKRRAGIAPGYWRPVAPMRAVVLLIVFVAAALTQFAYFPPGEYHPRGAHRWINDRPDIGGQGDYVLRPREPAALPAGMRLVSADVFIASRKPDSLPVFRAEPRQASRLVLPVLWYPDVLEVTVNGRPARYGASERYVTVDVPAGRHLIAVRFVGLGWANQCSAGAVFAVIGLIGWKVGRRLRV